jgi:Zn-dependent protease
MIEQLYIIPVLLFSVVVHEVAHGWVALKLGDPTARILGRLTLNPLPHIDLVGSILVPLFSILAAGRVFIAWAKPVPVNSANFLHPRRDDVLVSIAGPLSNLLVALVCSLAVVGIRLAMNVTEDEGVAREALIFLLKMFYAGVYLNIILAVFNMIPVPPLDGSHVAAGFLPRWLAARYASIGFFGVFLIIFLMRVPAVAWAFNAVVTLLATPFRAIMDSVL